MGLTLLKLGSSVFVIMSNEFKGKCSRELTSLIGYTLRKHLQMSQLNEMLGMFFNVFERFFKKIEKSCVFCVFLRFHLRFYQLCLKLLQICELITHKTSCLNRQFFNN